MRRKLIKSGGIATSLVAVGTGYYFGKNVPFHEQWPLYEALRTTASIIFAVVGAWLAIIYPERLKFSLRGNGTAEQSKSEPASFS